MLLLPPVLALVPRGAAPLAAAAGLCAAALLLWVRRRDGFAALSPPTVMLGALLLWGGVTAAWSLDAARSLALDLRLAGLFAAALALAAAAMRLAGPRRLAVLLLAGTAIGIGVAFGELASGGGLSRYVSVRIFGGPRLNQIAVWLAIVLLPCVVLLYRAYGPSLAAGAAVAMGGTVFLLDGTGAKIALVLSLPVAALVYVRRRLVTRIAAGLSVLAILTAPLTLPLLAKDPAVFAAVDGFKNSAGHRLLIWSFTGDRILERPLVGWGLDSARAIPGGRTEIRPSQQNLPLHPHDAALQVWLELGAPGAALLAGLVGWLWLRLGSAPWPPIYAAAAGGSLAAVSTVAGAGWGIWQEWWIATLAMALFAVIAMARATETSRIPSESESRDC